MDGQTRSELLARLSDAEKRKEQTLEELRIHAAEIKRVRQALGKPYFYGGRAADDPESEAHFTGYASHDPSLRLYREWQDVTRERLARQLRAV
jgi:hypothetical protein